MKSKDKNKQLADTIIEILRDGLTLNADTLHYIDSTFSNPSVKEIKDMLRDESNCETDSLIELLFFPDETIQLQLEDLIGNLQFCKNDEEKIAEHICRNPFKISIQLPNKRGSFSVAVTRSNIAQFIPRLNISRKLDPKLLSSIAENVPEDLQTRCKVKLRNAKPIRSQNKITFLCNFFENKKIERELLFGYVDFILSLVDELEDSFDMFNALMTKKKFYFQNLQKAKNIDNHLKRYPIETLLLQGKRMSYIDQKDAREKMQMIDRIAVDVFSKTEFFDSMPAGEQSITLENKEDIDKLVKELS
jgi:hypothetical protein